MSPHDCVGTNLYGARAARPADARRAARERGDQRDLDRRSRPLQLRRHLQRRPPARAAWSRHGGEWKEVDWEDALEAAARGPRQVVRTRGRSSGTLAAPTRRSKSCTFSARIARGLGSDNIDHRLRRAISATRPTDPLLPLLGCSIAELDTREACSSSARTSARKCRSLAHRVRKAAAKGAKVAFLNPRAYDYLFPVAAYVASRLSSSGAAARGRAAPRRASAQARRARKRGRAGRQRAARTTQHRAVAAALRAASRRVVLLGALAQRHPAFADLRALAAALAARPVQLGYLRRRRQCGGRVISPARCRIARPADAPSRRRACDAREMLDGAAQGVRAVRRHRAVAGPREARDAQACAARRRVVVALTPFASEDIRVVATCSCRSARSPRPRARTSMSKVAGRASPGAARPPGEARPGWKVLRVLGNLLELAGLRLHELRGRARGAARELEERRAAVRRLTAARSRAAPAGRGRRDARGRADLRGRRARAPRAPLQATRGGAASRRRGNAGMMDAVVQFWTSQPEWLRTVIVALVADRRRHR